MADKLHFDLVSPERLLMAEAVDMVVVPGSEGDFGVLAGHAPLMSTIRPGFISVKNGNQPEFRIFIRGGFAEVNAKGLTILAEEAIPAGELNAADLDAKITDAEEDLRDAKDDAHRQRAQEIIDQLRQIRQVL
ncbi:MAG: F0F1 ATP synthase subunit epsilon [Alphaproteobacteria bacterium]|nr:F0F1 ATP synthase subunit epsilon [Alphaproteobacteria bacterium]